MKRTIRLKESELRHMIAESVRRVLREANENDFFACIEKAKGSKEYQEGFRKGVSDARKTRSNEERNKLLDTREWYMKKYQEFFEDGNTFIAEEPGDKWRIGWMEGVMYEFKEADAYEEIQNQDYEPGWQFK